MPKKSFSPDVKILALEYIEEGRHTLRGNLHDVLSKHVNKNGVLL